MTDVGGWNMPQQFSDLIDEHLAARATCGMFDISHLGKFRLLGNGALERLSHDLTANLNSCRDGHCLQSLLLRDNGIILDRMTIFRQSAGNFFLLGSASLADSDFEHLKKQLDKAPLELINETDSLCGIALTGPDSHKVLAKVIHDAELPRRGCFCSFRRGGQRCTLSRSGLVTPDGYELFCPAARGIAWFEQMLAAGAVPCGHKTGEYLRISHGKPDMAHDMQNLTPAEANLHHLCSANIPTSAASRLVSLRCHTPGHPLSPGDTVQTLDGGSVGRITSAAQAAGSGHSYAMAYISSPHTAPGTHLQIVADGKTVPVMVESAEVV